MLFTLLFYYFAWLSITLVNIICTLANACGSSKSSIVSLYAQRIHAYYFVTSKGDSFRLQINVRIFFL